eukprot:TRINITY_DN59159_c0_g2_i1.p1 TRINITY_DN59159_c0_g2~~TRINITY_DN59159_c0_g2_i1.p1  ORF type:complete len:361 (+),score=22.86 TRINITY_DN59159_c0_g2_i1:55-1137(+)
MMQTSTRSSSFSSLSSSTSSPCCHSTHGVNTNGCADEVPIPTGALSSSLGEDYEIANTAFREFIEQLNGVMTSVSEKWHQFQQSRHDMLAKVLKCAENVDKNQKVKLNIGGQAFTTTVETLLSEKETFFSAMLQSGNWKPDADGEYFVDRSPQTFGLVLEFLRTHQKVSLRHLTGFEHQLLQKDVDFYGIDSFFLVNAGPIVFDVDQEGCTLQDDGRTLVRTQKAKKKHYYTASFPPASAIDEVIRWTVIAKKTSNDRNWYCRVGIAQEEHPDDPNAVSVGMGEGQLFTFSGEEYTPFIDWSLSPDPLCHTLDLEYNRTTSTLTLTGNGKSKTVPLPSDCWWSPVVFCNPSAHRLAFTIA